jgi:hypothetical protein
VRVGGSGITVIVLLFHQKSQDFLDVLAGFACGKPRTLPGCVELPIYISLCCGTNLVDRVTGADDPDVLHDARLEVQVLPGAARVVAVVDHAHPVLLVHRHLDVVRVRPGHTHYTFRRRTDITG